MSLFRVSPPLLLVRLNMSCYLRNSSHWCQVYEIQMRVGVIFKVIYVVLSENRYPMWLLITRIINSQWFFSKIWLFPCLKQGHIKLKLKCKLYQLLLFLWEVAKESDLAGNSGILNKTCVSDIIEAQVDSCRQKVSMAGPEVRVILGT